MKQDLNELSKTIRELQVYLQAFVRQPDERGYIINGIRIEKLPVDQSEVRRRIRQVLTEVLTETIDKYQRMEAEGFGVLPQIQVGKEETVRECVIPSRMNGGPGLNLEKSIEFLLRAEWISRGYLEDPEGMSFEEWLNYWHLIKQENDNETEILP